MVQIQCKLIKKMNKCFIIYQNNNNRIMSYFFLRVESLYIFKLKLIANYNRLYLQVTMNYKEKQFNQFSLID